MTLIRWVLLLTFTLGLASLARAGDITSAYTKLKFDECKLVEEPSPDGEGTGGGAVECVGYEGIPVYVAEGDLRMFVSFGANAKQEVAAGQTLPNFNTVNETLEWRLSGGWPFATILRWFPDKGDGSKPGSILIVTQISPGTTCQVARIDAQANPNANVLARQAADQLAGEFDCSQPPEIIGNPGRFQ